MTPLSFSIRLALLLALTAGSVAAQTYTGSLAAGDAQLSSGEFFDRYTVIVASGQWVEADLTASGFDPYLILVAPSGAHQENDDHEGSRTRSYLRVQAGEAGTWQVIATSYASGETGDYRLVVSTAGAAGPSPSPAPAPSGSLVGEWYSGSPSVIQYMDPVTGQSAPTSGLGQFLVLNADGTYRDGGILRMTTYSCTSEVYVDARGTYRVTGTTLVLNQTAGRSWGHVCGGQRYDRTLDPEMKTYGFTLRGDTLTRTQNGEPYDELRRGQ